MGKAHSEDLRERVVGEIAAGASRRQAAVRFKIGVSSAIRWANLKDETGGIAPRSRRRRAAPLEAHADWLLALLAAEPDLTLEAIVERLAGARGFATSERSIRRFLKRRGFTFKKNPARGRAG